MNLTKKDKDSVKNASKISKMGSIPKQNVLNFGVKEFELDFGVVKLFNDHIKLMQKDGLQEVRWRTGNSGFELIYEKDNLTTIVGGVTKLIPRVFGNEDMNAIIDGGFLVGNERGQSSRALGSLVHNHVFHMVECGSGTGSNCKCGRKKSIQLDDMNVYAKSVIRFIKQKGWAPLRSELGIYSPDLNVATQVDLLCMNEDLQYILISLKTGYSKFIKENETFKFRAPLDDVWDTRKNRHQLQLLIEKLILERNYKIEISQCAVMYVNSDPKNPEQIIYRTPGASHLPMSDIEDRIWNALSKSKDDSFVLGQIPCPDFSKAASESELKSFGNTDATLPDEQCKVLDLELKVEAMVQTRPKRKRILPDSLQNARGKRIKHKRDDGKERGRDVVHGPVIKSRFFANVTNDITDEKVSDISELNSDYGALTHSSEIIEPGPVFNMQQSNSLLESGSTQGPSEHSLDMLHILGL